MIFVGNVKPPDDLLKNYPEFKWIYANVKPCQCYQIAFWEAKGELIMWTADDADYIYQDNRNNLDRAYNAYKDAERTYNDKKTVIAMRPVEGGNPNVQEQWHFYYGGITTAMNSGSKMMAPFGLINREYFIDYLGGYDIRFISGQSENDVCMRVYEDGGRVIFQKDAWVVVHHHQVHPRDNRGREDNKFRKYYNEDRKFLESCWTIGGYGAYERLKPEELAQKIKISDKRLIPFKGFEKTEDICIKSQGPKGENAPWS